MKGRKATTATMKGGGAGGDASAVDEVEQLLQAAQDEVLLNLSVDSHISRSDHLLPSDLDRRFKALKSRPSAAKSSAQSSSRKPQTQSPPFSLGGQSDDDLLARFAALRASSSSNSSSAPPAANVGLGGLDHGGGVGGDDDVEDEVEKIIQWAKDAARLDPSPPSDDEDDDVDSDKDETDDDNDDNDDDDDDKADSHKKGQQRK